jgi:hypothetical protein
LAHVVTEKPETPWCLEIAQEFEWHAAQVYPTVDDAWHVVHRPPAPLWVFGKACGPLYEIVSHPVVVWQAVHVAG